MQETDREREGKRNLDKVTTNKWESRIPSECTAMWLSKPVTLCVDYCLHFKVFPSSALEGRGWGCVLPCGPVCPSSHLESPLLGAGHFLFLLFPIHCSLLRTVSFTAATALVLLLTFIVAGLLLLLFPSKSLSVQQPEWSLKMFIISSWPQNKIQKPYQWASMVLLWPLLPSALRSTPWPFCSSHTDFLFLITLSSVSSWSLRATASFGLCFLYPRDKHAQRSIHKDVYCRNFCKTTSENNLMFCISRQDLYTLWRITSVLWNIMQQLRNTEMCPELV